MCACAYLRVALRVRSRGAVYAWKTDFSLSVSGVTGSTLDDLSGDTVDYEFSSTFTAGGTTGPATAQDGVSAGDDMFIVGNCRLCLHWFALCSCTYRQYVLSLLCSDGEGWEVCGVVC